MNIALPNASVTGFEKHVETVSLPDPDDRHVVAAAIWAGASTIITWNLRDFPIDAFEEAWSGAPDARRQTPDARRQTPDTFLAGLYEQRPDELTSSLANARRNLSRSHVSASDFVGIVRDQRLTKLAALIEKHLDDL